MVDIALGLDFGLATRDFSAGGGYMFVTGRGHGVLGLVRSHRSQMQGKRRESRSLILSRSE